MDFTGFVRGGLSDGLREQFRAAIPAEFFDYPDGLSLLDRCAVTYQRLRHAGLTAPAGSELLASPPALCALLERAAVADPALFHVMLLHYTLVLAPILRFGDENTAEVRRRLEAMETFGAVAMTEAGRSNSHIAPRTTARFEPESRTFVLTTPDDAAMKSPTTTGHPEIPKTGVVYAQLVVGGEDRGVFVFVVPFRDATGAIADGLRITPAPDNRALAVDCAALRFTGLRVPFGAWLAAGARIAADGSFHDPSAQSRLSLSMATAPDVWRVVISASAAITRACAAGLLRHSTDRVAMGRLAPGRPLIGFRNQQDAVLSALARAYALTAVANHVKHDAAAPEAAASGATWTPWAAVDLTLPLLKAATTAAAEETASLCRVHSGALGFVASDRLNGYRGLLHGYLTAAGDNQLILFDTARAMTEQGAYQPPEEVTRPFDLSFAGCLGAARTLEQRLRRALVDRTAQLDPVIAWNSQLSSASKVATVFAHRVILEILDSGPPELRPLFHWHALDWCERHAGPLLDEGIASAPLIGKIGQMRDELRADLLAQADALAADFELPELARPPFRATAPAAVGADNSAGATRDDTEDFRLTGKCALVTGASRGIGRAIAMAFASAGADVAISARNTAALEDLAKEIIALGRRALVLPADLADSTQTTACAEQAIEGFGRLDILVNNAGTLPSFGPFVELPPPDWDTVMTTNFDAAARLCRRIGPHMLDRGRGTVINVASVAGLHGIPVMSAYAAAKAATVSLTRTLAVEWAAQGVRVNALCPGWVKTDMTALVTGNGQIGPTLTTAVPAGRWGEVADVTGPALFLASDASRFVTGQALVVDGGLTSYAGGPGLLALTGLGLVDNPT